MNSCTDKSRQKNSFFGQNFHYFSKSSVYFSDPPEVFRDPLTPSKTLIFTKIPFEKLTSQESSLNSGEIPQANFPHEFPHRKNQTKNHFSGQNSQYFSKVSVYFFDPPDVFRDPQTP